MRDVSGSLEASPPRAEDISRNSTTDIDEAEIFQGAENSLRMEQTYTHAFRCVFELSEYPFDKQVGFYISLYSITQSMTQVNDKYARIFVIDQQSMTNMHAHLSLIAVNDKYARIFVIDHGQ